MIRRYSKPILLCPLALALLGFAQERLGPVSSERELWIFFSPADGDLFADLKAASELAKSRPGLRVRPCLLVDDFSLLKKPGEVLVGNVKSMATLVGEGFAIPVMDEQGLAVARAVGIERFPAFVLLETRRPGRDRNAHVLYGRGANLKELFSCE